MKLKVYVLGNLDGVHRAVVAAPNQREACRLMGSTLYSFKQYGGQVTTDPEMVKLAMKEPGRVWMQKLDVGATEWKKVPLYPWNIPKFTE